MCCFCFCVDEDGAVWSDGSLYCEVRRRDARLAYSSQGLGIETYGEMLLLRGILFLLCP